MNHRFLMLFVFAFALFATSSASGQRDLSNQRFTLVPFQESMMLLDTLTGECWILRKAEAPFDPPTWQAIPRAIRDGEPAVSPETRRRDRILRDQPEGDAPRERDQGRPDNDQGREAEADLFEQLQNVPVVIELNRGVEELRNQLNEARVNWQTAAQRFGEDHPDVVRRQRSVQQAAQELQRQVRNLVEQAEKELQELQRRDRPNNPEERYQLERTIEAIQQLIQSYRDPGERSRASGDR